MYTEENKKVANMLRLIADFLDSEHGGDARVDACIVIRSPVPDFAMPVPEMVSTGPEAERRTVYRTGESRVVIDEC